MFDAQYEEQLFPELIVSDRKKTWEISNLGSELSTGMGSLLHLRILLFPSIPNQLFTKPNQSTSTFCIHHLSKKKNRFLIPFQYHVLGAVQRIKSTALARGTYGRHSEK